MATIGGITENINLSDLSLRQDPSGKIQQIVELLAQTNMILEDATAIVCNQGTNHLTTVRTGVPTATWKKFNFGVPQSKSQTQQVTDSTGKLMVYSRVDKDLLRTSRDPQGLRASEDMAFLEGMSQQMATAMFYSDTDVDPEQFMGLSPRYDTPATTKTEAGYNMLNGGGVGSDNMSMWLLGWGPRTVHTLFADGMTAGFKMTDLGEDTVEDADGGEYQALRTLFEWNLGLTVRDWRYVVRICNIDVSNLVANSSAANLVRLMIQAQERIQSLEGVRPVWYGNRTAQTYLRTQITENSNVNLTFENVAGKPVMMFDGIPVRRCEALLNTEATITGTFATV